MFPKHNGHSGLHWRLLQAVEMLSLTGDVESFGKRGAGRVGHLRDPIVCEVDSAHNVLVADNGNNQLQLYEPSAQWSIVKLRPLSSVKEPRETAVIGDRLYVISRNRNTVSVLPQMVRFIDVSKQNRSVQYVHLYCMISNILVERKPTTHSAIHEL